MNFTIDRDVLIENLNVIARGLPNKSPMPILMGILIEVTENDVFLTSSNTDLSVEVVINDASLNITKLVKQLYLVNSLLILYVPLVQRRLIFI